MPRSIPLFLALAMLCVCVVTQSHADWNPKIYSAIKWTAPNQGRSTLQHNRNHGITQVPMVYHGGVDTNASGEITENNIETFGQWIQDFLPMDYCGPVVLDYEQPWWEELRAKTLRPQRLQEILSVYIKGIRVAHRFRSAAQWGYWGLPALRHTGEKWKEQELSIEPLVRFSSALYPEVYNCNRGVDRTAQVQQHISTTLELAAGRIPVYVFISPKYCGEGGNRELFIPDDIFLQQINAVLRATWIDPKGTQHRIKGVILWDSYGHLPEALWHDLDLKHKHYFELLQMVTEQWTKAMMGKEVIVEPEQMEHCQRGLTVPANSSAAIYDRPRTDQRSNRVEDTGVQGKRVPSGRVPN